MTRETFDIAPVPLCIEAEQQLLGALLRNNEILAAVSPYVGLEISASLFTPHLRRRCAPHRRRSAGHARHDRPAPWRPPGKQRRHHVDVHGASLRQRDGPVARTGTGPLHPIGGVAPRLVMAGRGLVERAAAMIAGEDPASIAADAIGELQQVAASSGVDTRSMLATSPTGSSRSSRASAPATWCTAPYRPAIPTSIAP